MKILLLSVLFAIFQTPEKNIDCSEFYKETLDLISVDGDITKKEETDQFYILYVKNNEDQGKEVVIKLLKNNTGKRIYRLAFEKTRVIKKKGRTKLSLVTPIPNGLNVNGFPDLCE